MSDLIDYLKVSTVSTGTTPTPQKAINWTAILLAIVTTALGTLQVKDVVNPPKPDPVPQPTPSVVVVEPVNPPVIVPPKPVPDPSPTPIVPPGPIVNGVSIVDARGKALGNTVDPGRQFTIKAPTGWVLTGVATVEDDADVNDEFGDNVLVCTLRKAVRLDVYVKNPDVRRPSIFQIQCNQAPQPPPVVVPPVVIVDPPKPDVKPVPDPKPDEGKTGKIRVLVLTNPNQALSRDQINAVGSPVVTDLLNTKCTKSADGRPAWHKWDKGADVSKLPEWQSLMAACSSQITSKSLALPVLCIEDGKSLQISEITNEASILTPLNAAFGG